MAKVYLIGFSTYVRNIGEVLKTEGHEIIGQASPAMARLEQSVTVMEEADLIIAVTGNPALWWTICPEEMRPKTVIVDLSLDPEEISPSVATNNGFLDVVRFPEKDEEIVTMATSALEKLSTQDGERTRGDS
jgi:hypothetical protein